ncbi:MAG: hypothetical protein QF566_00065 [Candidatus Thalassarchaeaceae archaeon]|jgi:hypothetical protein|nr:hypothetical protein [Candidatus Thalassarchaeaceae archaeon]
MASVSSDLQDMIDTLMGAMKDAEKHERGTDAASRRLRGVLSQTAKACKALRSKIQSER